MLIRRRASQEVARQFPGGRKSIERIYPRRRRVHLGRNIVRTPSPCSRRPKPSRTREQKTRQQPTARSPSSDMRLHLDQSRGSCRARYVRLPRRCAPLSLAWQGLDRKCYIQETCYQLWWTTCEQTAVENPDTELVDQQQPRGSVLSIVRHKFATGSRALPSKRARGPSSRRGIPGSVAQVSSARENDLDNSTGHVRRPIA